MQKTWCSLVRVGAWVLSYCVLERRVRLACKLVCAVETQIEAVGVTWGYGELAVMKKRATRPTWEKGFVEEGAVLGEGPCELAREKKEHEAKRPCVS